MDTIDLAYVGLGIHEQLVIYVAEQQDYYAEEGVHVALPDGRTWNIERLRRGAIVGLGRAQVSRLRDGIPWVVLCVNTDRPLFWLLAREGHASVGSLRGRRVAVHPPTSAPGCWARILLRRHGLDPDNDVETVIRAPGDYSTDLRMLREGSIDAALVGSTLSPEATAAEQGLRVLAFVGEEFPVPTTGVAVDPTRIDLDAPAVRGLVRANMRALRTILTEPDIAIRHMCGLVPSLDQAQASDYYDRYIGPYFRSDGQHVPAVVAEALPVLAAELGVSSVPKVEEIYRTDLAMRWTDGSAVR